MLVVQGERERGPCSDARCPAEAAVRGFALGVVASQDRLLSVAAVYFLPFFAFCWARWTFLVCVVLGLGDDLRIVRVALRCP